MIPGKGFWRLRPVLLAVFLTMLALSFLSLLWSFWIFVFELSAVLIVSVIATVMLRLMQQDVYSLLSRTAENLSASGRETLEAFPLPAVATGVKGEVLWYNDRFRETVLSGRDVFGEALTDIVPDLVEFPFDAPGRSLDVSLQNRRYSVYGSDMGGGLHVFYWIDDTELKRTYAEYHESRPSVMILMLDNYDELVQNAKEGERSEIIGMVEKTILAWAAQTNGFVRRADRDKYIFVLEERHLKKIIEGRFGILDSVRQIVTSDRMPATLSIGVGRGGASLAEGEEMARQALDMALGRGGDQAAVRTRGGFEFYGGVSKAVEKRTKVRTRIIASALSELIDGSGNVLIMGHRNSDLDVIGSASALYRGVTFRGREARVVVNRRSSLAQPLINQLEEQEGYRGAFIGFDEASSMMRRDTLLIIVDTHRQSMLEFPELYRMAKTVVVIDHHRKMVDFIDNAVIFYHEPFSSSASEMVSELLQYIADNVVTNVEANALLAGITLDTRNFTVRTGVRTFEAAAYLRRKGADTASVRLLFSGSMENFNKRYKVVSSAKIYKNCAVSVCGADGEDYRVVAPQAADELLSISGVNASFVLYPYPGGVAISARSMGRVNVQLVMEMLGGGGHQTMAGVQLPETGMQEARKQMFGAIDKYFDTNK